MACPRNAYYFYLPRMNTAENWLSLNFPALERAARLPYIAAYAL